MISAALNDELKNKYCPEGSDLRKAQIRMTDMLVYVDSICKKYKINYWLDSGTLLGAVRHGGFIPWDDDVDICIEYKDAKKLIKALRTNPHPDYVVQDRISDKNHWREWFTIRDVKTEYIQDSVFHNSQKFKGLQVDVFLFEPYVNHSLWYISAKMYRVKLALVEKGYYYTAVLFHHIANSIVYPVFRIISRILRSHTTELHKVYGQVFDHYLSKSTIFPIKEIQFEGRSFQCPNDTEAYLKEYYGKDYLRLPNNSEIAKYNHNVNIKFL